MAEENTWVEQLPEEVRDWQEAKTSDTPEKFWQQMGEMRGRMGNSIRIPSGEAGEDDLAAFYTKLAQVEGVTRIPAGDDTEAWAAFYDKAGRPGKAGEYQFNASDEAKAFYHGIGLSEAQAARIAEDGEQRKKADSELGAAEVKENYDALVKEWGDATTRKMAGIKHVLMKYDPDGSMARALEDPKFSHAPAMLKLLSGIGDEYLEKVPPDGAQRGGWGITPAEAKARADETLHNPDSPRNNPNHPGHKAAQEEYMRQRHIASGEARG